jgi:RNA polymerase sigma factor (sigma-70 family)
VGSARRSTTEEYEYIVSDSANTFPMNEENDFRVLMCRVRGGSPDAICELICKYEGYIRRAVRRAMDPKLRSKFDSMDFVQLAWKSFFRVPRHAHRIETGRDFIAYVAKIARNKVLMEDRHRRTQKHNIRREVPLSMGSEDAVAREPQPMDTAIALERLEHLLKSQTPLHRKIIELRLQGDTFTEIGKKLNIDLHTAQRFISRLGNETPK